MRPTRIRFFIMKSRIVTILIVIIIPLFSKAQHMDFFGITMGQSLDDFEKCLVGNGVVCSIDSEGESIYEDEYLRIKFYSFSYRNREYSISVECTKYSRQVTRASVSLLSEIDEEKEEFLQRAVGRIVAEYEFNKKEIEKTPYRNVIKFTLNNGYVHVAKVSIGKDIKYSVNLADKENVELSFAEHESDLYNKEVCKELQDKYNNPLFYDKNPRFANNED